MSDHAEPLLREMFPKCDDVKRCGWAKTCSVIRNMERDAQNPMLESLMHCAFAMAVNGSNDWGS